MSRKSRRRKQSARGEITFQIEEKRPTRAFVLHVSLPPAIAGRQAASGEGPGQRPIILRDPEHQLAEAVALSEALELEIVGREIVNLSKIHPATLLGPGKVEELAERLHAVETELVIVNTHLSPGQQRNLEKAWDVKVLDRTGLILEIFGHRARTKEGRLQVELAQHEYRLPRLTRAWTHLARQAGGGGGRAGKGVGLRGPGEKQLEMDRRAIKRRIAQLERLREALRTLLRRCPRSGPVEGCSILGAMNGRAADPCEAVTSDGRR